MNDYSIYKTCVDALRALVKSTGEYISTIGSEPASGSIGATELSSFRNPQFVHTAFGQGIMLAAVVHDHVESVLRAMKKPVLTVAPWSCTRSTLEAAALACWFLDPEIDVQERVARSFAFRYQGLIQQTKLSRVAQDTATLRSVNSKIDRLEQEALRLGYSAVQDRDCKTGGVKRRGVGRRMPAITDLVDKVLDRGSSYRVLSAFVHGQPWALQQVSFKLLVDDQGNREVSQSHGVDLFSAKKAISGASIRFLCLECADVFGDVETSRCRLFGADPRPVEALHASFFERVQDTCAGP